MMMAVTLVKKIAVDEVVAVKRCKCEKGVTRFVLFEWTSLS
jgi:hypothetical protein